MSNKLAEVNETINNLKKQNKSTITIGRGIFVGYISINMEIELSIYFHQKWKLYKRHLEL